MKTKRFVLPLVGLVLLGGLLGYRTNEKNLNDTPLKIAILAPMEHQALNDIIHGFKAEMQSEEGSSLTIEVGNASGDKNLMRSLLKSYISQDYDYLLPIGMEATQMAISMKKPDQFLMAVAADLSKLNLKSLQEKNVSGVTEEIPFQEHFKLYEKVFTTVRQVTLVYSTSEKVYDEVQGIEDFLKEKNIKLQKLMIQQMGELNQMNKAIHRDSDFIFILKDHLVVSGISQLAKKASELKIPILTSDEGSIKEGGCASLGVKEEEIGMTVAKKLKEILVRKDKSYIPEFSYVDTYNVFINPIACEQQGLGGKNLRRIKLASHESGHQIFEIQKQENLK